MVDVQKIDAFFNGNAVLKTAERRTESKRSRVLRFAKLVMPSIAALLIGLILILPNFKKENVVSKEDLTLPQKGELEKLHAEDASFSMTDADGKISSFTADSMDETSSMSKVIKIQNPKGKIPLKTEEKFVDIIANTGFFDQAKNTIRLEQNVKAVYDNQTTFETNEAEYDFNKAYGQGQKPIHAYGSWGKIWADGFSYDKNQEILYLNGKSKLIHEGGVLKAFKQARYYKDLNKIEAEGNVVLEQASSMLYADKVVMWFENEKQMELRKVEGFGHVKIRTEDGVAQSDKGIYLPQENKIELEGNVSIQKDNNIIYGDKAVTNTETKISRMIADEKNKKVSGIIRGSSIKRKKHEEK